MAGEVFLLLSALNLAFGLWLTRQKAPGSVLRWPVLSTQRLSRTRAGWRIVGSALLIGALLWGLWWLIGGTS